MKPTVKRIPRAKKVADPLAVSAKPAVDPLAVKTDVPDPLAKVATPSTAKRITRRRKPVDGSVKDMKTGFDPKSATPPADFKETLDTAVAARKTAKKKAVASKTTPTATGLSPKAVEAIEKAKKAMDAEPPKAAAKKSAVKRVAKPTPAAGEKSAGGSSPFFTPAQRKIREELFDDARALVEKAKKNGFMVRITKPAVEGFDHETSIQTTESTKRAEVPASLLQRFDALYKEIVAAGGKVVGDLILDGVVFKYNPDAPARASARTPRGAVRPATKTVLKKELEVAVQTLMDKAKDYGFYLDIANTADGTTYASVTPLKK